VEFGNTVIDVNGMIYDFTNRPISNYTIHIGEKYWSTTDINGRFLISNVPVGEYIINGEGNGYESYQGDVLVKDREQIIYIRVPSFSQLLDLVDLALSKNQLDEAENYIWRANLAGGFTTELLFYMAVIKYRQKDYSSAIINLRTAIDLGSTDIYVIKFLNDILNMDVKNDY
jgi:hypothetical protein